MTVGLVGSGSMGSALGAALRDGGHEVITCLAGRSARTAALVSTAGLHTVPSVVDLVSRAEVIVVVTPPAASVSVARNLAAAAGRCDGRPLIADLNAISPFTVDIVAGVLAEAGLELVDGAISGPPPTVRPGARIYLSGPRANEIAALRWHRATPIVVAGPIGQASAVKMCTASVYKGVVGVLTQALRTAANREVIDYVLADLDEAGYQPLPQIALAATKAARYVPEMREIARTQAAAGLSDSLFEAMAGVYEQLARTALARADPESAKTGLAVEEFVAMLHDAPWAAPGGTSSAR
jgi:3-hydroxyisobutyrate dehydrogenase-like beta-hydroxyacid dehydrogenase